MRRYLKPFAVFGLFAFVFVLTAHGVSAVDTAINLGAPPESVANVNIGLDGLVKFVINTLIIVGIVLSIIFLVYGGIRWIISGGDKGKVDSARGTIVAAIVGLIIVILAWVIINAVLQILTGNGLTTLHIRGLSDGSAPTATPVAK